MPQLHKFPSVVQTPWSCAAACVVGVDRFLGGPGLDEADWKWAIKTQENVTRPADIVKALRIHGFKATLSRGTSLPYISQAIEKGRPVIARMQAYNGSHYIVIVGVDRWNVRIMDPMHGEFKTISKKEFMEAWWDRVGRNVLRRLGITIWREDDAT